MTDWRGLFPFSVGAPSWVLPLTEDNFVGNILFLADKVDKVQILCFEKDPVDELLNEKDLKRLVEIQRSTGLKFSVHLPADLAFLATSDDQAFKKKLDCVLHIADITACLEPENMILHLDEPESGLDGPQLVSRTIEVLGELKQLWTQAPSLVQVENTNWDLTLAAAELADTGFGVCADFGHLYHQGYSLENFLSLVGPLVREVHLHGFNTTKDHLPLGELEPVLRNPIEEFLKQKKPSVVIENFKAAWLQESLIVLDSWCSGWKA